MPNKLIVIRRKAGLIVFHGSFIDVSLSCGHDQCVFLELGTELPQTFKCRDCGKIAERRKAFNAITANQVMES